MNKTDFEYEAGDRVELHPVTDAWMQGDKFGQIERVGLHFVYVRMDRSLRLRRISFENIGRRV